MTVLEVAVQGCPLDVYFSIFVASGLFIKIIAAVLTDNVNLFPWIRLITQGKFDCQFPEYEYSRQGGHTKSWSFTRLFAGCWAISRCCASVRGEVVRAKGCLLSKYSWEQFDSIGQAKSRKLNAMGLTALLRTNDPAVLSNLGSILNVWFNVLSEVNDSEGGEYSHPQCSVLIPSVR